jgi:hypothetical protein
MRGERRKLLGQMLFPARGAQQVGRVGGAAQQFFKRGSAIVAAVFEDGHFYSTSKLQILSIAARISEAGAR